MKNRYQRWLAACMFMLLGISIALPAWSNTADRPGFTAADKAYYLPEDYYIFIRPGLVLTMLDFEIPSDLHPVVTFSLTDPGGLPLDLNGVYTPGPISMRFTMAYIPEGTEDKMNYFGAGASDRNGEFTLIEPGVYTYVFDHALPDDYDQAVTTTMAMSARRDLREFDLERYSDNVVYNFVPDGGTPNPRDIATTTTCNNCHNPLALHGGNYVEVQMCTNCHNPQLENDGLSYSFPALVHRVHSSQEPEVGAITYPPLINDCQVCHVGGTPAPGRPLVANPNPISSCDGKGFGATEISWSTDGPAEVHLNSATGPLFAKGGTSKSQQTGNWVKDDMDFFLVDSATGETLQKQNVDLTVYGCVTNPPYAYPGEAGAWHANWMTQPSRTDCGACHSNIDWETGDGHAGGPQDSDEFCSFCHQADSGNEYDRSVYGAHIPPLASDSLKGLLVEIKQVTNTGPGQHPTVLFSLKNKSGLLDPSTLNTFTLTLNGPNTDFDVNIRENAIGKMVPVGNDWSYTFSAAVPMGATGSYSVGYEGRVLVTLDNGSEVRDAAENTITAVAVTDSTPKARRHVVDDAKCEACHSNLSLHGDNRKNANEYCQTCHMPGATDEEVRTSGTDESIHFKYMIHKIHRGEELENGFLVYGYRSSIHDYSEVTFPGDLRDCETCHLPNTYTLPTPAGALPTVSPSTPIELMPPMTASCLSCHDGDSAAAHAAANTSSIGESCTTCHGDGKTYAVLKVHAR